MPTAVICSRRTAPAEPMLVGRLHHYRLRWPCIGGVMRCKQSEGLYLHSLVELITRLRNNGYAMQAIWMLASAFTGGIDLRGSALTALPNFALLYSRKSVLHWLDHGRLSSGDATPLSGLLHLVAIGGTTRWLDASPPKEWRVMTLVLFAGAHEFTSRLCITRPITVPHKERLSFSWPSSGSAARLQVIEAYCLAKYNGVFPKSAHVGLRPTIVHRFIF